MPQNTEYLILGTSGNYCVIWGHFCCWSYASNLRSTKTSPLGYKMQGDFSSLSFFKCLMWQEIQYTPQTIFHWNNIVTSKNGTYVLLLFLG